MTRHDYILIAEALKQARVNNPLNNGNKAIYNNGCDNCAHRVADTLAAQSRGFDRELFLRNCGVQL